MRAFVKTPSRLHVALIDLKLDLGRADGSFGLGLDYPNTILEASRRTFALVQDRTEQRKLGTVAKGFLPQHGGGTVFQASVNDRGALVKLIRKWSAILIVVCVKEIMT